MSNLNGIEESKLTLDSQRAIVLVNCHAFPHRFDGMRDNDRADLIHYAVINGFVIMEQTRHLKWQK